MTENGKQDQSRSNANVFHGPGSGRGAGHGKSTERARDVRGVLRRLMGYLYPHRYGLYFVFLFAGAGTAMAIAGPYLMGLAIDRLVERDLSSLLRLTLLMLGAYFLASAGQLVQGIMIAGISQRAMRSIRADLFHHFQTLSLQYFDTRKQGDLMSRLTNDLDSISQVLTYHVTHLFTGILTLAGILVVMFVLSPWLAFGSMISFPLMIGLVGLVGRKTRTVFRDYQSGLGAMNSVLEETYSGQRVILAFGQEKNVLSRFDEVNETVRRNGIRAMSWSLLVLPMMGILSNLNVAVVCGLGGWLALQGMVSIGTIAAFITYSRRFAEPLRQMGNIYNQIQGSLAGAERIFEILNTPPDETESSEMEELPRLKGDVKLENVTFSYVPGIPVLKDVTIHARPGERIALVGHTGAGKTTLVNLLSRFYDPQSGAIRFDDRNIREVSPESLRRQLGVVLQQSFLFSESVMENIRYGRLTATDDEVIAAATLARADGFIRRLPRGYRTALSERGANLSEGQRQLVTIARAILADPAILILDEATSSVDTRTEQQIQSALQELMKGRTSFVIAHRLSTIVGADQVIVIDEGRVVERGTHGELLAMDGIYRRLHDSQFRDRLSLDFDLTPLN